MRARWSIGAVILLSGCGGANAGQSDPQACAPVAASDSTIDVSGLQDEFVIRLIADTGSRRGESTEGRLQLVPQDSAYRSLELPDGSSRSGVSLPLYGTADIDFEAVGAVIPGDARSEDPASPGVLVIESPDRVLLRVGSEANRRGMRRFDGAYTVLQVQQVTAEGFTGTWRSGVHMEQSGGHFCAKRSTG
ncbi:hypothetical protein BH24GEM1_BH24GEM1_23820 [soil metagenome]